MLSVVFLHLKVSCACMSVEKVSQLGVKALLLKKSSSFGFSESYGICLETISQAFPGSSLSLRVLATNVKIVLRLYFIEQLQD